MLGRPLHLVEWLELGWRTLLVALLIWVGVVLRDLAVLRANDSATVAWAWATNQTAPG